MDESKTFLQHLKRSPFWPLNLAAWAIYGLVSFGGAVPYIGVAPHLNSIQSLALNRATFTLLGLLGSGLLRVFSERQKQRGARWLSIAVWLAPIACLIGVADTYASNLVRAAAGGSSVGGAISLFGGAVTGAAVFLCWCACYLGICIHGQMETEHRNALRAEANAREAQWMALRAQLNPHFLFNSLNSVQALIDEDPKRAGEAIGQLASLLRHSLNQESAGMVPLAEEIEMIEKYLAIEKIRFEKNLRVCVEVQAAAADWHVPSFPLHPLVENAVRYGMQTSAMPLALQIRAAVDQGNLQLEVANTGRWLEPESGEKSADLFKEGNGLGLELVRNQLEQSYPERYSSSLTVKDGWVIQRIQVERPATAEPSAVSNQITNGSQYAPSPIAARIAG